jgi:hypothetical protein
MAASITLVACSGASQLTADHSFPPSPAVPAIHISGLRARDDALDIDVVSNEAEHPEVLMEELQSAGFIGGSERALTGRRGVFSRVIVRGWSFWTEGGAAAFLSWLGTDAAELIGDARTVSGTPPGVTLSLHTPSGCCHEEVPIYLAAWQRGATVWTVRASGTRIRTAPVVALVMSVEKET